MRRDTWRAVAAIAALSVGASCAEGYARLAAPYYGAVARLLAVGHPWTIVGVGVAPSDVGPGTVLRLVGEVRRQAGDVDPAAIAIARVHVGEVVEGPVVFWTMLLLWPGGPLRQRLLRCCVGLPIFLALEAATTAVQLVHNLPAVTAILAGAADPVTPWECWSRFLEGAGKYVLEVCGVLLAIAIARALRAPRVTLVAQAK